MDRDDVSRRALLRAIAATLGAAALPAGWMDAALAATDGAATNGAALDAPKLAFFNAADAADVEAVAAQIIPTDDTPAADHDDPGARLPRRRTHRAIREARRDLSE